MKTNPFAWSTGPVMAWEWMWNAPVHTTPDLAIRMQEYLRMVAKRSPQAQDLRTPKYKPRVVPNKKRALKIMRRRRHALAQLADE